MWKNLQWWAEEQRKPRSERQRPGGRFNPLVDPERQIAKVAGEAWQGVAQNRQVWSALGREFLAKFDVEWSSGKQSSLQNLSPNHRTGERSNTARMIQTC